MKKLFLLVPLFALLAFSSNNSEQPILQKATVISGTITNPAGDKVKISSRENRWETEVTDGNFELSIELEKAEYLSFRHGNESSTLYLEPGDNVNLTIDPEQFDETIHLTGSGAEESNYLFSKYLLDEKLWENYKEIYSMKTDDFLQKVASMNLIMQANLDNSSAAGEAMNPEFLVEEQNDLKLKVTNTKLLYPSNYKRFTKEKTVVLGDNYLDFMKDVNLNDESLVDDQGYNRLLNNYVNFRADQELAKAGIDMTTNPDKAIEAKFAVIEKQISSKPLKDNLMYRNLSSHINFEGTTGVKPLIAIFNQNSDNQKRKDELGTTYAKATTIAKGQPAPDFSYPDLEGTSFSLETFKGRYVYIDVWATWCAPCLKELPHLEELQETYKGNRNIAFTSISIDKNKDAWRKMVTEKKMKGFQLIADNAWGSSICSDYMIRGIPRFILIDREGKILDQHAPRPSSDELKDVLANLLSNDRSSK